MKYIVRKIFTYSETVEVEAGSDREAKDLAMDIDGELNDDDSLHECKIIGRE